MLSDYLSKVKTINKTPKERRNTQIFEKKMITFSEEKNKLFDISSCKCEILTLCDCPLDQKIPHKEHAFIKDQRTERKMVIGALDTTTTKKNIKTFERKMRSPTPSTSKTYVLSEVQLSSSTDTEGESETGSNYEPTGRFSREASKNKSSEFHVRSLAIACDRAGVSDRSAAIIASSVLKDVGVVNEGDLSLVVDRNKVRRARKRVRSDFEENEKVITPLKSIYFDGRKDRTMTHEKEGSKTYKRIVIEEHVTIVQEPDSNYVCHVTPITGSARNITATMMDFFHTNNVNTDNVVVIGCDGTAVNTGSKGGVIRLIEERLQKPLQWIVCLLHSNELPLRHLIHGIDGKTSGPVGFTGIIGQQLPDCEKNPIVQYDAIESQHIDIGDADLSTDQMYLLEIYKAVSSGDCPVSVAKRSPGKMAHSRWLTTASRMLRLYVSTEQPSENLTDIVTYIMKVYVPMWFAIKSKPLAFEGSKHIYHQICLSRSLNERTRRITDVVLQRNAFFAHPEHILTTMIGDERRHIRELAWRRILKARKESKETIRVFKIPNLILDAADYTEMILWSANEVTEPPVTRHLALSDIESFISTGQKPDEHLIPKFPCHTQAVERLIKLVTDASYAVSGEAAREGYIKTRLFSRSQMAKFNTKKQFKVI